METILILMINKNIEDASLFLYFIKKIRETPDKSNKRLLTSFVAEHNNESQDDKYKCIYCGCEYVYRRSLISHLKRLHNIKNIE